MEQAGVFQALQLQRIACGSQSPEIFPNCYRKKEKCANPIRQYSYSSIHQPFRRTMCGPVRFYYHNLDSCREHGGHSFSQTFIRGPEFLSQLPEAPGVITQVETTPTFVQRIRQDMGILFNRQVCSESQYSAKSFQQLVLGPRNSRSQCYGSKLEDTQQLCQCPLLHDIKNIESDRETRCRGNNNHPMVASTAVVQETV